MKIPYCIFFYTAIFPYGKISVRRNFLRRNFPRRNFLAPIGQSAMLVCTVSDELIRIFTLQWSGACTKFYENKVFSRLLISSLQIKRLTYITMLQNCNYYVYIYNGRIFMEFNRSINICPCSNLCLCKKHLYIYIYIYIYI